jgi:predicted metallopeptidase
MRSHKTDNSPKIPSVNLLFSIGDNAYMPIKYLMAPDIQNIVYEIIERLHLIHILPESVHCVRSQGSRSRRIIARIHGLGKIWQTTLSMTPSYIIEVISEHYDPLSQDAKEKVLIHELLHIPKGFSGGFRPHKGYINRRIVDKLHEQFQHKRKY